MLTTSTYDYAFATKSNVIFKEARYDFGSQTAKTRDSYLMIVFLKIFGKFIDDKRRSYLYLKV